VPVRVINNKLIESDNGVIKPTLTCERVRAFIRTAFCTSRIDNGRQRRNIRLVMRLRRDIYRPKFAEPPVNVGVTSILFPRKPIDPINLLLKHAPNDCQFFL